MKGRKPKTIKTAPEDAITEAPRAPAWLSHFARAEWKRVTPILVARGVLTHADLGSLENYCVAIGTVRECQMALQRDGTLARVKPVDPSFFNWPALPVALADTIVPDFPLTNRSFNLSYAGNDL